VLKYALDAPEASAGKTAVSVLTPGFAAGSTAGGGIRVAISAARDETANSETAEMSRSTAGRIRLAMTAVWGERRVAMVFDPNKECLS
jgi:hypothetical protein